jgi:glycosyltransferase involved in cell wall biosynthesis
VRVLIMPKWYPWPDRPVFGLFCREQARAAALGNDVRVLAFTPEPMSGRRLFRTWEDPAEAPPTLRLVYRRPRLRPAAMATQLIGMRAVLRGFARSGWRPDVIHAHVFEAGFPAVLLGRRLGCPVVVSEHFTAFQRGLVRGSDRRLARYCFRRADLVCPVSESLRRELEAVEPRGRYRVVPNVVDTETFHPGDGGRRPGLLRLLNVAALAPKKRHEDLLDALARLRERGVAATLDVIGEGERLGPLQQQAAWLGLGDAVRFLGPRPPAEVAEAMRAADVFVLPSRFENLPVVLLEAMATGLPVVATTVGGVPEIVDEAAGALVPAGDVAALADGIAAVAARDFDAAALARRARERYGMEAIGELWDGIYAELVTGRPAPAAPARASSG